MIIAKGKIGPEFLEDFEKRSRSPSKGMSYIPKGGVKWWFYNDIDDTRVVINMETGEIIVGGSNLEAAL